MSAAEFEPILDLERFPMPESLENDEFIQWCRSLNADAISKVEEEIIDAIDDQLGVEKHPWILDTFEGEILGTPPSLLSMVWGKDATDKAIERAERNILDLGITLEEFQQELREARTSSDA